jgi:signal transduction histidine kinase
MLSDRLRISDIRNTSTFRLTVLLGLLSAVGVVALLGIVYGLTARELTTRTDQILRMEASRFRLADPADLPRQVWREVERNTGVGLNYFALISPEGERVAGDINSPGRLVFDKPTSYPAHPGQHGPIRLLAIRLDTGETILIGRDMTPITDLRQRVLEILLASGLGIAIIILIWGVMLSIPLLRRVRDLQRASREIAAGHLDRRMPISGRGDELDQFASTVNLMVEDVGRVVAQVKSVTDAVAHDLRTPLTRVKSQLFRIAQQPGLDAEIAARLDGAMTDLDNVLDRFAALLRISEIEASQQRAGFATVALDPLVSAVADLYEPLAEEGGIRLVPQGLPGAAVHADHKLLFEAVSNLVDNAIKFSPPGGTVRLSILRDDGDLCLDVRDDGPGIPETERDAVLRRFHRGDDTAEIPGSGLGLSVVSAIVHLHHFQLEMAHADPGLIVRIRCPQ